MHLGRVINLAWPDRDTDRAANGTRKCEAHRRSVKPEEQETEERRALNSTESIVDSIPPTLELVGNGH